MSKNRRRSIQVNTENTTSEVVEEVVEQVEDNSAPEVIETETAYEEPQVVETAPPVPTKQEEVTLNKLLETGTDAQKNLILAINNYCAVMAPGKPITSDAGAKQQFTLWHTLRDLIENTDPSTFNSQWNLLLLLVNKNIDKAFKGSHAYRFLEHWMWGEDSYKAFQNIMNIITNTCTPEGKSKFSRIIDVNRALSVGISEAGRQKIINFYN